MNKEEAMKRLDSIENEAKELRKIIEGNGIEYEGDHTLYVALRNGAPYILIGGRGMDKDFYSLRSTEWRSGWSSEAGQDAINEAIDAGSDIHVFTDTREALQFFIDNLKE